MIRLELRLTLTVPNEDKYTSWERSRSVTVPVEIEKATRTEKGEAKVLAVVSPELMRLLREANRMRRRWRKGRG